MAELYEEGVLKIRFQEHEYVLVGNLEDGGAIATAQEWESYAENYAHLCSNGDIKRYHAIIGNKSDIQLGWQ